MTAPRQYLIDACSAANDADHAYELALTKAGYKTRWDIPYPLNDSVPAAVQQSQANKHIADTLMNEAFKLSRYEDSLLRKTTPTMGDIT